MAYTLRISEIELIEGCTRGDRLAQKQLYHRYKDAMYTLAYRITGDFDLAAEALQDGFLRVFRKIHTFRRESSLGAWIKTIVVRTALKKIKSKLVFEELTPHTITSYIDWGHSLDADYLEKAIMALSEGYRTVFTLIEIEGYTHKEVAAMLRITEGTSKSQLFYAKKKLREKLAR